MTVYYTALRSRYSSWANFEAAVRMEGGGYDDTVSPGKWYTLDWNSNATPRPVIQGRTLTASGTTPTEYRTMAVSQSYITRQSYVSDGSSSSTWHRGRGAFAISGGGVPGDTGYRTAEDSGGAINGYHIDDYIGTKTAANFDSIYGSKIYKKNGYYFVMLSNMTVVKG